MGEGSVPVDLLNPGQVFACLGFMEVAHILCGDVQAGFDWSDRIRPAFWVRANGHKDPIEEVLRFLDQAEVKIRVPASGDFQVTKWKIPEAKDRDGAPFPYSAPESEASLPAVLVTVNATITVDHWGDTTDRDNVKFWAGAGGNPGAAIVRELLKSARGRCVLYRPDPFSLSANLSSGLRLDWRRDYIPLDTGFSLNNLKHIKLTSEKFSAD